MKLSAVITAAALAFAGTAFAQADSGGPGQNAVGNANPKAAKNFHDLANKTRRGMHNLGDKMRHGMNRDKHAARHDRDSADTAAMGAGSDTAAARQRRMDDAYANWQRKYGQR